MAPLCSEARIWIVLEHAAFFISDIEPFCSKVRIWIFFFFFLIEIEDIERFHQKYGAFLLETKNKDRFSNRDDTLDM
jgi:hypothetical protein